MMMTIVKRPRAKREELGREGILSWVGTVWKETVERMGGLYDEWSFLTSSAAKVCGPTLTFSKV